MQQACSRFLHDLVKSRDKAYLYKFDAKKANRVCSFIEKLPHTKGQWARPKRGERNTIKLEAWQIFITCQIFGWVEKATGFRRFNEAYVCVPRKNAKSTWAAAVGLYMFCADGEYGAEVYSGATKEKQAMEVFRPARLMVRKTPGLENVFGIENAIKALFIEEDGSRFEPLVGDPGDGASPSCAIVDEYHEHETPILHDTMQTGMGAREQPLLLDITTAGSNTEGPCHILQEEIEQILGGYIENDNLFGIVYMADAEAMQQPADPKEAERFRDNFWKSEEALRMANPNYGVSVFEAFLLKQQRGAIQSAHKANVFKTKHLNIWVNAAVGYFNMDRVRASADPSLSLDQFKGKVCYEGVDLGRKVDLASRAKLFTERRGEELHYTYFGSHYIPEDLAMDGDHQHYEKWVGDGLLATHPGIEIKLGRIEQEIREEIPLYDRKCVAFDDWSAPQMRQSLEMELGDDVVLTIPQTTKYLSEAMKELDAAVLSGRFHYSGDRLFTWAMSNVIAKEDNNENVFPRKEQSGKKKIDPVSALLNAMSRACTAPQPKQSVYETRGLLVL